MNSIGLRGGKDYLKRQEKRRRTRRRRKKGKTKIRERFKGGNRREGIRIRSVGGSEG